jgi:hypothetical protein
MQAFPSDYALIYFTTPKRQLGLTTVKFKPLVLPMHGFLLVQLHIRVDLENFGWLLPVSCKLCNKFKVEVTSRLPVYRQSVYLGVKPFETHDQRLFFATEPLRS